MTAKRWQNFRVEIVSERVIDAETIRVWLADVLPDSEVTVKVDNRPWA